VHFAPRFPVNPSSQHETGNADGPPLNIANAAKQPLASHCALVGLVAQKHMDTHHPRRPDWALGALLAGFLHDTGKLDPAFQAQLAAGGPPDSPFGAGPRIHEMSWALTHLAFDPAKMRRQLPSTLAWPVIQYVVYWRQYAPINSWETKRFASLSQISSKAGTWMSSYQESLTQLLAEIKTLAQVGHFEVDPIHTRAMFVHKDGKRLTISYWCEVCYIRTYTPGTCVCCQKYTDLDLKDADEH